MKEKLGEMDQIIPYLITHPYHALVVISLVGLVACMIYFFVYFTIKLKTMYQQNSPMNGKKHKCECSQILPQINLLFKKQDKMWDAISQIQERVSYLYGRFSNKN